MKKRLLLFSVAFVVFYALLGLAKQLPALARGYFSVGNGSHSLSEWVQFTGDIGIYYLLALSAYLLLFRYHPGKRYLPLISGLLLICIISFFCALSWTRLFEDAPVRMTRYFQLVIFPIATQVGFATVFYLVRYSQYKEVQQVALELQNRKTELSLLRSQINPHFLFNHLNNIYSLVSEQSPLALPAISGLSELLRYMLYNSDETVLLSTEINYLEKYVALQQLRFEHPSEIEITRKISHEEARIPPFLLIPFIENAFKHGKVSDEKRWLNIEISSDPVRLDFICSNAIGSHRKDATGGIGIHNVKQRLNLLYTGRYRLDITSNGDLFIVKLQLLYGAS
ncbi:sensor histidine kinase [Dyadobacter sp. Leaf189]|uniref:sensor histidine kinase n=1 Tax=Dyadobacter sp. Leaf189 TaxID=1736295 RepID=UPI0006F20779|nr:histidine kinase [Dyadobacter sp. Leaf189]KQS30838.1 hypothetical protein ASG33_10705 [Dyadobacter sp. Leaf189]